MKKILAAILMLLLCASALAEEASLSFETFAQGFEGQTWKADGAELIQVMKLEEAVTVCACLENEAVVALSVEFSKEGLPESAKAAIEKLGWLDAESMAALLAMQDDGTAVLGAYQVVRIHGEDRDAYCICALADFERMVWQPIHGGTKIHDKTECSGMDVARMITEEAAEAVGWDDCKRCRKGE